ncbi:uncharacterized protein LOC135209619 isoform X3 [Macrobrachium nipponense]|uniref:uncharacterized protein LOC135209619 isoform X3 n=1 Tax=Macrobrachium nipponense TaxID=159736 RepID=UPI0030C7DF49
MPSGNTCCVADCRARGPLPNTNIHFHRFPANSERCEQWLEAVKRPDLFRYSFKHLNRHYKVCSQHFDANMYMHPTSPRLTNSAVPNVFGKKPEREKHQGRDGKLGKRGNGESSKDSTSSSDPPASNVPAPKTLGKETVSTPVSNQDKTKDYINKGNSSSIANPRLILPKLSLILVPCAPEVPKETQSKSEEPPKAAGSEEPPKASENQEPPDISDSQGPPNVSESQGSPGVSESQPVVQNAAKQQNAADNLTDVLPVITSTPPHHSASMKLKEIKEELLDISEVYTDQDIPTEYGNLSPVHHRSQITKEKLETTGNDPLQLDCFDSDDVTELVTDNSQPCRTDTIEKKKVIDTRNKRKGTETPNKRRGTDISNKRKRKRKTSDESEELTGSNEMGEENRMEESGCDTFGKFIALQLRQLPIKNALNLQMDIHNLIAKERLKVLQEEMGKPVKVANKRPRNDSSRHKSSTKKAAKDKITYREKTTVNEEPNTKSRSVKKTASVTKQSKDSIQQEVPHKRSRYSGSPEKQSPVTTCLVLDKGSPYQGIPLTKPIVNPEFRVQGSLGESSPVITAAIVPQPNELYTFGKPFGNESLLNIPLTKSEAYHDDISPWDAPSPISVKSEAESISSL